MSHSVWRAIPRWMGAIVLLVAALGGASEFAHAQRRVNESCSAFSQCGSGLSCIPFRQVCHRDSGALEGEACQAGYGCASGFTCEAGTQVCRGPGKSGDTCHVTKPCGPGLSCQPGVQRCYAVPRALGEPCSAGFSCGPGLMCEAGTQVCRGPGKVGDACHATRPCGDGLTCEAGTQTCRAPSRVGEACHATRPCADGLTCEAGTQTCRAPSQVGEACHVTRPCAAGLSCQPGSQKCYHSPRQMCEPCSAGYSCASGLSCQAASRRGTADWQVPFEALGAEILRSCRGPSGYQIKVTWAPSPPGVKQPSTRVKERMQTAVERWRTIIQGPLPNPTTTLSAAEHQGLPDWIKPVLAVGSTWNDLHIVVRIAGKNEDPTAFAPTSNVLAYAGELVADATHGMPRLGHVQINELQMDSDIAGYTEAVLMHEIGHILGFNRAMWQRKNLLSSDRRSFVGRNAMAAWRARGQSGGIPLQWVDNDRGLQPGGHWAGSVVNGDFESELMRPTTADLWSLQIVSTMYATRLTTGALQDFGYTLVPCEGTPTGLTRPAGGGTPPLAGPVTTPPVPPQADPLTRPGGTPSTAPPAPVVPPTPAATPAGPMGFVRLESVWKAGEQIHIESGPPTSSATQPGWLSADWRLEPAGPGQVRIRNRWKGTYLHVETGALAAGPIEPGWQSALWITETVSEGVLRFRNAWRGTYLNIERGVLEASAARPDWLSAQWRVTGVAGGGPPSGGPPSGSPPSGSPPSGATAAGTLSWVPSTGAVPANAVVGGQESGRGLPVCRAAHRDGVHPGKVVAGRCNIGWGGQEIVLGSFEVLVNDGVNLSWTNGPSAPGMVMGGQASGQALPICRASHEGGLHPGKVWVGLCHIGWGGREIVLPNFQVLVSR